MHELQLASELVRLLGEQSELHEASRILSVNVVLGEFTCVEKESLRVAFEWASEGGPAEGAELRFKDSPLVGRCAGCGETFVCMEHDFRCPVCGGSPAEYVSGQEFELESMEVSD